MVREISCRSAITKCGFPGGGWAINPYVGCAHSCLYCYARFMRRFTGHNEKWGDFVDIRVNAADMLKKEIKKEKYNNGDIHIGTVTDPYQPLEEKYELTRKILEVLSEYPYPVSILTKSDLVLRDLDIIKKFENVDINFTINTIDEDWKKLVEPNSPSVERRLKAIEKLRGENIKVYVMMGPYWPFFTDAEKLIQEFKRLGIDEIFTESFNTTGGNFTEVGNILRKYYPQLLPKIESIFFNKDNFYDFYNDAQRNLLYLSEKYDIKINIYFGIGHAAKFEES
ncbi:MAG TPA: radical SAM protein [Dictyoglomaceae bacterium]|nr:radical SAM protein [Dictyoglomaceae bacterium]